MNPVQPIIPNHSVRDIERRTTRLWLTHPAVPDGEYDVRGGIAWPVPTPEGGIQGFAVILGRNVATQQFYWLAETPWVCWDHVVEGGRVAYEGVAPWFADAWRRYYVAQWYYRGERALAWRYMTQIKKSAATVGRPAFAEMDWQDDAYPVAVLRELRDRGALSLPRASAIFQAEMTWSAAAPGSPLPGCLVALCAVLTAMEEYTWEARRR